MKIQNHTFLTIFAASCILFCDSCNRNDCPPPPQCSPQTNEATAAAPADKPEAAPNPSENVPAPSAENAANANHIAQPDPSQNKDLQANDKGDEKESENDSKDNKNGENDEDKVDEDSDEENSEDEEACDDERPDEWLDGPLKKLTNFGRRHEILGDMSEAKWADLEPKLPVSILKVSPDNDVIKKLESMFKYNCDIDDSKTASNGTSVQLIVCSKKDVEVEEKEAPSGHYYYEDESGCQYEAAGAAYLSLVSPKDHNTRVYNMEAATGDLEFGTIGFCGSTHKNGSLSLIDVESRPFMDTTGLYVRTKASNAVEIEKFNYNSVGDKANYTTWLFAGDNLRLVTDWIDSSYSTDLTINMHAHGNCDEIEYLAEYSETYMYYEAGEFKKTDSKTANNNDELIKLLINRP